MILKANISGPNQFNSATMADSNKPGDVDVSQRLASAATATDVAARSTMELTDGQKRAFDKLLAKSQNKCITFTEGEKRRFFEETLDCPNGFAVVAKDFLPNDAKSQSIRDAAVRSVAGTDVGDIDDMISFITLLLDGIQPRRGIV